MEWLGSSVVDKRSLKLIHLAYATILQNFFLVKKYLTFPKFPNGGGGEVAATNGVRASLFDLIISDSFVQNGVSNYQKNHSRFLKRSQLQKRSQRSYFA